MVKETAIEAAARTVDMVRVTAPAMAVTVPQMVPALARVIALPEFFTYC
jgi:hypothetical protein